MSADELVPSRVHGKLKEIHNISEDGVESVPSPVLKVIGFFRNIIEAKFDNANLLDGIDDLILELDESSASKRLACDRVQKAEARLQASEGHLAASDLKYLNTVYNSGQAEKKLRTRAGSLAAKFEVDKDRMVRFAEGCMEKHTGDPEAVVARQN